MTGKMNHDEPPTPRPFVRRVNVKGYGCVKEASLQLTRMHALIGPNDSGKSTLLRAIRTTLQFAGGTFSGSRASEPFDPGIEIAWDATRAPLDLSLEVVGTLPERNVGYRLFDTEKQRWTEQLTLDGVEKKAAPRSGWNTQGIAQRDFDDIKGLEELQLLRRGCHFLRLDPTVARRPSRLIPERQPVVLQENGEGLSAIYDVILNRGDDAYQKIVASLRTLFPTVKGLALKTVTPDTKAFVLELVGGERVPASMISDGILYFLAFSAVEHLDAASMVLIEEPENGLHPARIDEVIQLLRTLSQRTQIVMTTHSPMVVNALEGDEVSVVTRSVTTGTRVVRLCDTPDYEERAKVFHNGELWVTYCNGIDEMPLVGKAPQ